jgi:beta-phosphoglucomutase-like phosphatase (HAD superfamily)
VPARAVIFDFNGTLSQDEAILCRIFGELFSEHGKPLSAEQYFDELAGLSDPEIVRTWLGRDHPDVDEVIDERVRRYRAAVADGSSVTEDVRKAVRFAAERVPVAVVSGAARAEIEPVIRGARERRAARRRPATPRGEPGTAARIRARCRAPA